MGEEYLEEDAGDACGVDAKYCPLSGADGERSNGELVETTAVNSGSRIKGKGFIGSDSNWSEFQSSGRPCSGTGKRISWLQDGPLGMKTCPSLTPSGSVDCQTSTGEWSRLENPRYLLGSNPCFFRWVLKEDDRRILDGQFGTGHLKGLQGW